MINTHYETDLIHHISHSWRNARNNNIMITSGRNTPSEVCQIFLNIGGAVFSFACTSCTVQLVLCVIKMMPFIWIILAFYIDVLRWLNLNISVRFLIFFFCLFCFWKGHNLNPSNLATTHNENSSSTFFEELHEGFDLQPTMKQKKRTEIT